MRSAAVLWLCLCTLASADLIAQDRADNDPYPLGFNPGDNAGVGFTPWTILETGAIGAMFTASAIDEDLYSWGLSGTYALGRGLSNSADSGVLTLLALHAADNTAFSGFNLKTSTDPGFDAGELLRFGLDPAKDTGISFSTNAGADYLFLDGGWLQGLGDVLRYQVSWAGGSFSLSVSNLTEQVGASVSGTLSSSPVAMIGMETQGANNNERLFFNALQIAAIPEPATWALCGLGLAALLRRLSPATGTVAGSPVKAAKGKRRSI